MVVVVSFYPSQDYDFIERLGAGESHGFMLGGKKEYFLSGRFEILGIICAGGLVERDINYKKEAEKMGADIIVNTSRKLFNSREAYCALRVNPSIQDCERADIFRKIKSEER